MKLTRSELNLRRQLIEIQQNGGPVHMAKKGLAEAVYSGDDRHYELTLLGNETLVRLNNKYAKWYLGGSRG